MLPPSMYSYNVLSAGALGQGPQQPQWGWGSAVGGHMFGTRPDLPMGWDRFSYETERAHQSQSMLAHLGIGAATIPFALGGLALGSAAWYAASAPLGALGGTLGAGAGSAVAGAIVGGGGSALNTIATSAWKGMFGTALIGSGSVGGAMGGALATHGARLAAWGGANAGILGRAASWLGGGMASAGAGGIAGGAASLGGMAGGLAGSFLLPGLAGGAAISMASNYGFNMFERLTQEYRIDKELREKSGRILGINNSSNEEGMTGFNAAQRGKFNSLMANMATTHTMNRGAMGGSWLPSGLSAYTDKMKELRATFNVATDMGLMDNQSSFDAAEKKFVQIVETVNKMSKMLKTTKAKILETMASIQATTGVESTFEQGQIMGKRNVVAAIGGMSNEVVNQFANQATAGFMGQGVGGGAVTELVQNNLMRASALEQNRLISKGLMQQVGGRFGAAQMATQAQLSMVNTAYGASLAMAFAKRDADGNVIGIDRERLAREYNGYSAEGRTRRRTLSSIINSSPANMAAASVDATTVMADDRLTGDDMRMMMEIAARDDSGGASVETRKSARRFLRKIGMTGSAINVVAEMWTNRAVDDAITQGRGAMRVDEARRAAAESAPGFVGRNAFALGMGAATVGIMAGGSMLGAAATGGMAAVSGTALGALGLGALGALKAGAVGLAGLVATPMVGATLLAVGATKFIDNETGGHLSAGAQRAFGRLSNWWNGRTGEEAARHMIAVEENIRGKSAGSIYNEASSEDFTRAFGRMGRGATVGNMDPMSAALLAGRESVKNFTYTPEMVQEALKAGLGTVGTNALDFTFKLKDPVQARVHAKLKKAFAGEQVSLVGEEEVKAAGALRQHIMFANNQKYGMGLEAANDAFDKAMENVNMVDARGAEVVGRGAAARAFSLVNGGASPDTMQKMDRIFGKWESVAKSGWFGRAFSFGTQGYAAKNFLSGSGFASLDDAKNKLAKADDKTKSLYAEIANVYKRQANGESVDTKDLRYRIATSESALKDNLLGLLNASEQGGWGITDRHVRQNKGELGEGMAVLMDFAQAGQTSALGVESAKRWRGLASATTGKVASYYTTLADWVDKRDSSALFAAAEGLGGAAGSMGSTTAAIRDMAQGIRAKKFSDTVGNMDQNVGAVRSTVAMLMKEAYGDTADQMMREYNAADKTGRVDQLKALEARLRKGKGGDKGFEDLVAGQLAGLAAAEAANANQPGATAAGGEATEAMKSISVAMQDVARNNNVASRLLTDLVPAVTQLQKEMILLTGKKS